MEFDAWNSVSSYCFQWDINHRRARSRHHIGRCEFLDKYHSGQNLHGLYCTEWFQLAQKLNEVLVLAGLVFLWWGNELMKAENYTSRYRRNFGILSVGLGILILLTMLLAILFDGEVSA